ncbi:MAG: DegT/DnrJ/EryC1/StrS family aminotransferase [Clostridiales Family XIII bacterium]|jgi:dTDP-4-amino-4,6-dideoxygalactose transaminase|nr:DegT/DnrJ/EryC1/StrS family aminotransferase [Clostridiales Family XIII bacterium]
MKREIPLSVPSLDMDIVENLRECVETGWVSTGGRFIGEFEAAVAGYAGAAGAVGCQSGTAGLHVALRALGVGPGDEVIVPTLAFIAAVNPVAFQGASPVFMDCDAGFCMDAGKLGRFCAEECRMEGGGLVDRKTGRRVAAAIVVHVFGNLADMEGIMDVAGRYGLKVIEDATEALGSYWTEGRHRGRHAGTVGDLGVYSFNANKIITTGGGGMIVSGPRGGRLLERARYLATTAKDDGLRFVHNDVGYNYRMLNIQAALGVSQIRRLESFIEVKAANYRRYAECLAAMGIEGVRLLPYSAGLRPNHWFYPFEVDGAAFGKSRDALMLALIDEGIQCRPVWRLCHLQRPYRRARRYRISLAARYEKSVLNLPCSVGLAGDDVEYVCEAIKRIGRG